VRRRFDEPDPGEGLVTGDARSPIKDEKPSRARTAPSVVSTTYFHAASSASGVSSKPTRNADNKVVSSTATHIKATLANTGTASIDRTNRL
jgi:hypothetical protein